MDNKQASYFAKRSPNVSMLLRFHVHAMFASLWRLARRPLASVMTLLIIGIVLSLPIGLYVLLHNVQVLSHRWHSGTQIAMYLQQNITPAQLTQLKVTINNNKQVDHLRYISPTQGLTEFQQQAGINDILALLKHNPLPGVLEVYPHAALTSPQAVTQLMTQLKKLPNVASVQLNMQWLKRLYAFINLGTSIVTVFATLLAFAVLLIIGNTIHLATREHRQEMRVMRLVGSTDAFIRRPFLYSGIWYGLAGGAIAWGLVYGALWWLQTPVQHLATLYDSSFKLVSLSGLDLLAILAIGASLGLLGSWIAVTKELTNAKIE